MIKAIIFDIDGVITDGSIIINENGNEQKKVNLKDIDAIYELKKKGFIIAAITGESSPIVKYFEKRFPWDSFYSGSKNKTEIIKEIESVFNISFDEMCYIGDGKYDVEPLQYVGLGICPSDAIDRAKNASKVILQNKAGDGCLWELLSIVENYNNENNPEHYFYKRVEEHTNIFKILSSDTQLIKNVMKIGDEIINLLNRGGQILLCGNGGSAADAQHIATEFISRFYKERRALNAEALTTNTSTITAIGNDYSYEKVFVRQLEAKGKPGDMLIGISTSGKSKNVIGALHYAKKEKLTTVILTGDCEYRHLKDCTDYIIQVPSKITPRVQEVHIFIGHLIAEYVEHELFKVGV